MHVQFTQQKVVEYLLCASPVPGPGNMAAKSQTKLVSRCFHFGGKRDNKEDNFLMVVSAMKKVIMFRRRAWGGKSGTDTLRQRQWGRGREQNDKESSVCRSGRRVVNQPVFPVAFLCKYPAVSHLAPKENEAEKAVLCQRFTI